MSTSAQNEAPHGGLCVLTNCELHSISIYPHGRTLVTLPPVTAPGALRTALLVCLAHPDPSWNDIEALQPYLDYHMQHAGAASVRRHEQLAQVERALLLSDPDIAGGVQALAARLDQKFFLKGEEATAIVQPYIAAYHRKRQAAKTAQTLARLRETLPTLRAMAGRPSTASAGLWAAEPGWLGRVDALLPHGDLPQMQAATKQAPRQRNGVLAVVNISGVMSKGESLYTMLGFGTNTVETRVQLAEAALDERVEKILLLVDSGGGEAAGTAELAEDIATVGTVKRTEAFVSDLAGSAAVWAISGANKITINPTGMFGSIGTLIVAYDESERFQRLGIAPRVVSTGPLKGAMAEGVPISDAALAELQQRVDGVNAFFQRAMQQGRNLSPSQLQAVSTGGIFMADRAKRLGLVDEVGSLEGTMRDLLQG